MTTHASSALLTGLAARRAFLFIVQLAVRLAGSFRAFLCMFYLSAFSLRLLAGVFGVAFCAFFVGVRVPSFCVRTLVCACSFAQRPSAEVECESFGSLVRFRSRQA